MSREKRRGVKPELVREAFTRGFAGKLLAAKLGVQYVERKPEPKKITTPPEPARHYTLADLEAAKRKLSEGDSDRHMNPGRTRRHSLYWRDQVSQIYAALLKQGDISPARARINSVAKVKIKFYINYTLTTEYLPGGIKHFQAGPFDSYDEANQHRGDVLTYDDVSDVWIGEKRDKSRQLMGTRTK